MVENVPPQLDTPEFQAMRTALMTHYLCSEEEAIGRLQALWNVLNEQDPLTPPLSPPPPEPDLLPEVEPQSPPRKKTTVTDFDEESSIPESLPFFPASYTTEKVKSLDYVELWYFTMEGILDASKITPTVANDMFGLLRTDLGLTLQQVKTTRASRNVICDEHLSL